MHAFKRYVASVTVVTLAVLPWLALGAPAATAATQVGFKAQSYAGFGAETTGGAITGQKPESKLWFNDGSWWAAMLSTANGGAHTIHKLVGTDWVDTGVVVDDRAATKEDVLSIGNTLYIASRADSSIGSNKLRRYTYASGAYTLDGGFPVDIPGAGSETLTLARDSAGVLWITFAANKQVNVAHSQGADTSWSAPYLISGTEASGLKLDDISSVISFTDDSGPSVGVLWSNQVDQKDYFAVHRDGAGDQEWTVETALSGPLEADDHISLKTFGGSVFAAVKTSATATGDPRIRLLRRSPQGAWNAYTVAIFSEHNTRPIAVVEVDPADQKLYVFMSLGEGNAADGITYKATSLSSISFPSQATTFIQGGNGEVINNATSMKANATNVTGIVVMASDGSNYWWNRLGGDTPPPDAPPTAQNASASTLQDSPVPVGLSATDPEECELTFAVGAAPAHGSVGPVTSSPCIPGSPNQDSALVVYTPDPGYSGPDSFTYTAADSAGTSAPATVSIDVTETPPPGTIVFESASSAGNAATASLQIPKPSPLTAGDVMVASVNVKTAPTITAPSGWTLVRIDKNGTAEEQAVYTHVAQASEPASYTWTFASAKAAAGGIAAFSGVDTTNPVDTSSGRTGGSSTSIVAPSVTTSTPNTMLVGLYGILAKRTITPPSGLTERWDVFGSATSKTTSEGATGIQSQAGATGDKVAKASKANKNIGQLIALKPAP